MKMKYCPIVLFVLLATACSREKAPAPAPEDIYNSEGLTVITSSFNSSRQTMSTLYGNAAALKAAGDSIHQPGEDYRLVTWKQQSHPLWFGSNKNGAVTTVERITITVAADGKPGIDYELVQGKPADLPGRKERAKFILAQRPSVFP
ncbi:hypothetical protein [Chitinophaga sp. YIM B06452]|uniref:hypothetical protein n=1 Tax=Chitinophaga sp. YIM B06452 TaxID=3082158 RepID=UPI0031FF24AC